MGQAEGFTVAEARTLRALDNKALVSKLLELLGDISRHYCNSTATVYDSATVEGVRAILDRLVFFTTFHRDVRASDAAKDARGACLNIARRRPSTPFVKGLAMRAAFVAAEVALRFPALRPQVSIVGDRRVRLEAA